MGWLSGLTMVLMGGAAASVPSGPTGAVLGPTGVGPVTLADLPDMRAELQLLDGSISLRDPQTGVLQSDGSWAAGTVTAWATTGGDLLVRADDAGRVQRVTWSSGRRMRVERDSQRGLIPLHETNSRGGGPGKGGRSEGGPGGGGSGGGGGEREGQRTCTC